MLNENCQKLVKALRSNKYKQGQAYLNRDNYFCCLGVACELAIESGVKVDKRISYTDEGPGRSEKEYVLYDGESGAMPGSVREWLGMVNPLGQFYEHTHWGSQNTCSLAYMNDTGYSFHEIADKIESEPEGLFLDDQPGD